MYIPTYDGIDTPSQGQKPHGGLLRGRYPTVVAVVLLPWLPVMLIPVGSMMLGPWFVSVSGAIRLSPTGAVVVTVGLVAATVLSAFLRPALLDILDRERADPDTIAGRWSSWRERWSGQ